MSQPSLLSFLLVEDSYADVLLLERELKRQGVRATLHCLDSLSALQEALTTQTWDMVLADYHVPGLPFALTLQEVLRLQPACPVVIVSGEVGEEVAVEQVKLGAADFVLKDRPARLGQVIQRALSDARARRLQAESATLLRRNAEELHLSAMVFATMREGVLVCDGARIVRAVNPAFLAMVGKNEDELLGKPIQALGPASAGDEFYRAVWASLARDDHWQGELPQRPLRTTKPLMLNVSTHRAAGGNVRHHIALLTDISDLRALKQQLDHEADYDPLTNLPNRKLLASRLRHAFNRARRYRTQGALLFIDLDEFKRVNDSKGHPVGDKVLQQVAVRLSHCLRDSDTLARYGGDEFVVVLEELQEVQQAAVVAQNLINEMHRPFHVDMHEFAIGASVGISVFPAESKDPDEVIQHADTALYQSKANGRGRYCFYTRELTEAVNRRQLLDSALRNALKLGEFELHYQPIVNVQAGRATHAEALVRWRDPGRGLIPPDEFIPYAEQSGLIVPLGALIIRRACEQFATWLGQGVPLEGLSINLSRREFDRDDMAGQILQVIAETGVPPERLTLEITETALLNPNHRDAAIQKLQKLRDAGIRVALDDFGMEYSSFSSLRQMQITNLKIDREFVSEAAHDRMAGAIVSAMIDLGRNMDLKVVAEGVETPEQLAFLRSKGCHQIQGYLLSRPVSAHDLPGALQQAEQRLCGLDGLAWVGVR